MIVDVIVPIIPPQARNSVPLDIYLMCVLVALVLIVILNKCKL